MKTRSLSKYSAPAANPVWRPLAALRLLRVATATRRPRALPDDSPSEFSLSSRILRQAPRMVIDTSVLVAQIDEKDVWHKQALAIADRLLETDAELVYFDCVINETLTVLCRRFYERNKDEEKDVRYFLDNFAAEIGKDDISLIYPAVKRYYDDCLALIRDHSGKVNFHDALIAIAAEELNISHIVSFDKDFDLFSWLRRIGKVQDVETINE